MKKEVKFIQKFFSINKYVTTEIFNNPERSSGIFHFELKKAQDVINTFSEVAKLQEDVRERNRRD